MVLAAMRPPLFATTTTNVNNTTNMYGTAVGMKEILKASIALALLSSCLAWGTVWKS